MTWIKFSRHFNHSLPHNARWIRWEGLYREDWKARRRMLRRLLHMCSVSSSWKNNFLTSYMYQRFRPNHGENSEMTILESLLSIFEVGNGLWASCAKSKHWFEPTTKPPFQVKLFQKCDAICNNKIERKKVECKKVDCNYHPSLFETQHISTALVDLSFN